MEKLRKNRFEPFWHESSMQRNARWYRQALHNLEWRWLFVRHPLPRLGCGEFLFEG